MKDIQEIKTIFSDNRSVLHVTSLAQINYFCEVMGIEYISDSKYDEWLIDCNYNMGIINVGRLNYSDINYYKEKDIYTVYEYKDLFEPDTKPINFKKYAISTEKESTQEERKLIFDFLTDNAENLFSGTAFIKSNDFISYDRSFIYSSSDFKWVYAEPNYTKGIYKFQ